MSARGLSVTRLVDSARRWVGWTRGASGTYRKAGLHALAGRVLGRFSRQDNSHSQVAFTLSVIALAAKLSKIDGPVRLQEFAVFSEVFPMPQDQAEKVRRLFFYACDDHTDFRKHARQIAVLFKGRRRLFEELVEKLFLIALADQMMGDEELHYLREVARMLGFSDKEFRRILNRHIAAPHHDPYEVLGVSRDVSDTDLKKTYRRLMREYHPDGLAAYGVSQELIDTAKRKVTAINEAYDRILRLRGLK